MNVTKMNESTEKLYVITVQLNMVIGAVDDSSVSKSILAEYFTDKLYNDPEYFGSITEDNIISITEW